MNILKYWVGIAFNTAPLIVLSLTLFKVWLDPMSIDNGNWVPYGVGLILLEFLIVHSGTFAGAFIVATENRKKRTFAFSGLLSFYFLIAWAFATAMESMSLLWVFCGITAGRFMSLVAAEKQSDKSKMLIMGRSALSIFMYLLMVFGSVTLPIPELGINQQILNEVYPNRGSGVWEQEPHRAIAAGASYFMAIALLEIFIFGWLFRPKARSDITRKP